MKLILIFLLSVALGQFLIFIPVVAKETGVIGDPVSATPTYPVPPPPTNGLPLTQYLPIIQK